MDSRPISVLLIGPPNSSHRILHQILSPPQFKVCEAITYRDAVGFLNSGRVGVAICDDDADNGNWQDLLADLNDRAVPSNLIVSSRVADDRLWAEVLNLGAYDLLAQPFDRSEVQRVVRMAWAAWCRRSDAPPARAAVAS